MPSLIEFRAPRSIAPVFLAIMLYYVSAIHTSTHYHMTHIDVTVNKRTAGQDQSKYK